MHPPDGDDARQQVGRLVRLGLVEHTLVALAGGAGLVRVDAGDEHETVGKPVVEGSQPRHIVADRVLVVGRAGPDDDDELVRTPGEDIADFRVAPRLDPGDLPGERVFRLEIRGQRQLLVQLHCHMVASVLPVRSVP